MNREKYMRCLQRRLRKLPKEDYERAIAYFTEYFDEAGSEREAQAIEDLGSPELAADQVIRDFAVKNAEELVKNVKRGFSALWIGILAIFAAPIALPLAAAFGLVILAMLIVIAALILSVFLVAISVTIAAVPCVIVSFWLVFTSFADGVATLGCGLVLLGAGILATIASIYFTKWCLYGMTLLFGMIVKGGRHYER